MVHPLAHANHLVKRQPVSPGDFVSSIPIKLLQIDLGGNWCLDCRLLAGIMELAPLKPWLGRHYEIVTVDIGWFDKDLQVPAHYGAGAKLAGVPVVLIVDPRTDRLINADSMFLVSSHSS